MPTLLRPHLPLHRSSGAPRSRALPTLLLLLALLALLTLASSGCTAPGEASAPGSGQAAARVGCTDRDGDGFGDGCADGRDCDDADPSTHAGCLRCLRPSEGCPCDEGTTPIACDGESAPSSTGAMLCQEGTRYCRAGEWSGCESIHMYAPADGGRTSLVDPQSGAVSCGECSPLCFVVSDNLDPVEDGLGADNSSAVDWASGGGLTLATTGEAPEAPTEAAPTTIDPASCVPGSAPDFDCDGIEDELDPYPSDRPFATTNPAIYLEVPAGRSATGHADVGFQVNSADVYLLVDQTASMEQERDQLFQDLVAGDFVQDGAVNCGDTDMDNQPNNELKQGGVIGAVRCMIRDAQFGTGLFRELPFRAYAAPDQVAFEHHVDISPNADLTRLALSQFETMPNRDWAEAGAIALNTLATGEGAYFGWDRPGIPARTDCAEGRWGQACFREESVPIVMMFMDEPMHNGPADNSYPYDASELTLSAGSDGAYIPVGSDHEYFELAHELGDVTRRLVTLQGSTAIMASDVVDPAPSCLKHTGGGDAVFRFEVSRRTPVTISTAGSRFPAAVALYDAAPAAARQLDLRAHDDATGAADLGALSGRYIEVQGSTAGMRGDHSSATLGCGRSDLSPDALLRFELEQPSRIQISSAGSSPDTLVALHSASPAVAQSFGGDDDNSTHETARDLGVIDGTLRRTHGDSADRRIKASYSKQDIGCGADNKANDVVFKFSVARGRRVRISSEGSSFAGVLSLWDATPGSGKRLKCSNKGESNAVAPSIEQELTAGTYYAVLKGKKKGDAGVYTLTISDATTPASALACRIGDKKGTSLSEELPAGSYYVVVKGDGGQAVDYRLSLRDVGRVSSGDRACSARQGAGQSGLRETLDAGTYYVVLKGSDAAAAGDYQLTIGGGEPTDGRYAAPTWRETAAALRARGAHVVPVVSACKPGDKRNARCQEVYEQAVELANATDTLGANLAPLVVEVAPDGSGLSRAVVDGIAQLARNLSMDVGIRVVFEPDQNPGFEIAVQAVDGAGDGAGDGCDGLTGVTHQGCRPGASPRFALSFTNPAGSPVPNNGADPRGGYNFRAELIGDGRFIVDSIPIYVLPQGTSSGGTAPTTREGNGSYWQDVQSKGCTDNRRPDWRDLSWSADVPDGTRIDFSVCTGETRESLEGCETAPLASVQGEGSCSEDSDCEMGFCGYSGACQVVRAGQCEDDSQCAVGSSCSDRTCVFEQQPVYIGGAIGVQNYATHLRMQVDLSADPTAPLAPTLYDWALTYHCTNTE